jgi:exodeoxyribonuclease VII large subunit
VRAPTPSAAAELLAPDVASLRRDVSALQQRARQAAGHQLRQRRGATEDSARRLYALSPAATLSRGYAIVQSDGHVVHAAAAVAPGASLRIQLHHGRLTSTVDAIEPES